MALAEHETVLRQFNAVCQGIALADWQREPASGKWSPAAVTLHLCKSYELGRDSVAGGPSMRMRVGPAVAWLSRILLLPVLLATNRFPRGVAAPAEVRPDPAEARMLSLDAASARLRRVAAEAATALHHAAAERSAPVVTHAYFGTLAPYSALRLLSAHTRHHARGLASGRAR